MESKILDVFKNKYNIENSKKKKKKELEERLRLENGFRVRLLENLKEINKVLDNDKVESVNVEVDTQYINLFLKSMYTQDLAQYVISQVDSLTFNFKYKVIDF